MPLLAMKPDIEIRLFKKDNFASKFAVCASFLVLAQQSASPAFIIGSWLNSLSSFRAHKGKLWVNILWCTYPWIRILELIVPRETLAYSKRRDV